MDAKSFWIVDGSVDVDVHNGAGFCESADGDGVRDGDGKASLSQRKGEVMAVDGLEYRYIEAGCQYPHLASTCENGCENGVGLGDGGGDVTKGSKLYM